MKLQTILKDLMKRQGLSATDLSRNTDIPLSTLHGWINGVEPKSIIHLKALATYFKVTIDYLCFGESSLSREPSLLEEDINIGRYEVILRRTSNIKE